MTKEKKTQSPMLHETMPHQINAPSFHETGVKVQPPFINDYGVTIGDSLYNSKNSPLNNWSKDVDPAVMAGDQWVHPTNDIGWNTSENRDLLQKKKQPKGVPFMHPTFDVSKSTD
ncbi:DUF3905 domain-containing protein [Bacillus sp. HMF5848]|uniref:DUF3905 domain-containing protein n=1 Tax=Bacillus sp. HMF5848 TaxID=2495421 RepID=UPI000F7A584E|nr:DUF3905 domain-containing protein [Bacillus sp. HMF5848]RSK26707.1 DUF3905 domain-containing protein [Bacillus sp. HMF5848]